MDFNDYYKPYLGIKDDLTDSLISCDNRNQPFCFKFKQILIKTRIDDKDVFSIAPPFFQCFSDSYFLNDDPLSFDNQFLKIDDVFSNFLDEYRISKMFRFTFSEPESLDINSSQKVITLSISDKKLYFDFLGNRGLKWKEKQWMNRKPIIEKGRYFILLDKEKIAAYSIISDIDYGGANIVVVTFPEFRKKGYGKALVTESVKWCFKNNLLPIYLVEQSNVASISLAKSLGFQKKSDEIIVSI